MASAFTHAFSALAIGKLALLKNTDIKFWILMMFCAVIPDADVLAFQFGIPYEHVLGHRGITHSLLFAFLLATFLVLAFYSNEKIFSARWIIMLTCFTLSTASHGVLDAMTTGGLGVAFFAPFDNTRYFFPFRPIQVSPIGVGAFFSEWGIRVLISEFLWVWIPSIFVIGVSWIIQRMMKKSAS